MSELRADTITASDGTSPVTLTKQQAIKSWVRVSGAAQTVADSFNTASVTDGGTGKAAPAFTNNMSNANYGITSACDDKQDGASVFVYTVRDDVAETTSGYSMHGKKYAYALADFNQNATTAVHGDLA
jgi:hypothetical protein